LAYSPEFRRFINEQRPSGELPDSIVVRAERAASPAAAATSQS
jgi:hypothetical protein